MGVIKGQCVCHFCYVINYLFCSAASGILAIDEAKEPITLVLAEDGTIVDDEDYFLCLPSDTTFVALAKNEKWPGKSLGTARECGRGVRNTPRGMRLSGGSGMTRETDGSCVRQWHSPALGGWG